MADEDEALVSSPNLGVGAVRVPLGDWIIEVRPRDAPLTGRKAENSVFRPVLEGGLANPLLFALPSLDMGREMLVECRDGVVLLRASEDERCLVKGAGW